ncbi:DUF362 domain-containing protein [Candidatus Borrarchaeum sp.]|uniref:DUF362 domain-containing protein n=1 Tax=Candidatus Borrarchaeum sp. TaxID=2846742 RepID=UPI00257BF940|nr:DUF362 domain-containing protein [Candidatus Borrarchaeum sp.]
MKTDVFLIKTEDRVEGINALLDQYSLEIRDKNIALKANYNSADPYPASTHIDTLRTLVTRLQKEGAKEINLGARSGMGVTWSVLMKMGVEDLADELGFRLVNLDMLSYEKFTKIQKEDKKSSWKRGFLIANVFKEADKIIQTCNLKTHRFGGHFTLSLKNSVGMIAKRNPWDRYDYMAELHHSKVQRMVKAQRILIAEINEAYTPALVLLDAISGFKNQGPEIGELIQPGLLIAGTDRIAIDAVGVALLRSYGTTPEVSQGKIFEQEQIAWAVKLGIDGVRSVQDIQLKPLTDKTKDVSEKIDAILSAG